MPLGEANPNYSDLRNSALREQRRQGGDRLRWKASGVNAHVSKSNRPSRVIGIMARRVKQITAVEQIRASINQEFRGLQDGEGREVRVGDQVIQRLGNPAKLAHTDLRQIDAELAEVLWSLALEPRNATLAACAIRTASMFEAASKGDATELRVPKWPR